MELGPQNHNGDGLLGPNSIIVVYMDPLGMKNNNSLCVYIHVYVFVYALVYMYMHMLYMLQNHSQQLLLSLYDLLKTCGRMRESKACLAVHKNPISRFRA